MLVLAGIVKFLQRFFFLSVGLCFIFKMESVLLITLGYFCYCWAVPEEHQGFPTREWAGGAQGVWDNKELGGDTSGRADPE